jgi:threonine/homoserine/homoserine lactone efflux protein
LIFHASNLVTYAPKLKRLSRALRHANLPARSQRHLTEHAMNNYGLFLLFATLTILSPGPGVLLTLSNAARHGWAGALPGIFGIASGAFIVAAISATSVGLILSTSAHAFTVLKYAGAAYLLYLGFKSWRSDRFSSLLQTRPSSPGYRFLEAASIQFLNPKAVFFFLAVFPQFIDTSAHFSSQFFKLVASYAVLVILVHGSYALLANAAKGWLSSPKGGWLAAKVSGVTFAGFGVLMASASR